MEDVVLHCKPGPGQDLSALIEATEKLLAPFPCRPPQVFSPWFPSIVDRHLPLRPARPPPRILSAPDLTKEAAGPRENPNRDHRGPTARLNQDQDHNQTGATGSPEQGCESGSRGHTGPTQRRDVSENDIGLSHAVDEYETTDQTSPDRGVPFVPETPPDPGIRDPDPAVRDPDPAVRDPDSAVRDPDPAVRDPDPAVRDPDSAVRDPDPAVRDPGLQIRSKPESTAESPSKRCWTVFTQRIQSKDRTKAQTRVQSSSRRFQKAVSKLRLQSRQRVKWVIDKNNCRDIEQVWRRLSRPPLGLALPSCCNAHIDRGLGQVWVYCDLLQGEAVGRALREGLRLSGRICLCERRLGTIYRL